MTRRMVHLWFLIKSTWRLLPRRLYRFILHPFNGFRRTRGYFVMDMAHWILEWPILLMDIVGFPECYEGLQMFIKPNTRFLTDSELQIGKSMIGASIDWSRVKIDDRAFVGPKQGRFAYVSFYLINYWGILYPSTFVHELIHLWQFERYGSVYLLRALRAQHSKDKYNYGGSSSLQIMLDKGQTFDQLNYEQQGDVLADYYLIKQGATYRGIGRLHELPIYEHMLLDVFRPE